MLCFHFSMIMENQSLHENVVFVSGSQMNSWNFFSTCESMCNTLPLSATNQFQWLMRYCHHQQFLPLNRVLFFFFCVDMDLQSYILIKVIFLPCLFHFLLQLLCTIISQKWSFSGIFCDPYSEDLPMGTSKFRKCLLNGSPFIHIFYWKF